MGNRILVTGKNGQLGQSLEKISGDYPQYEFTFVGRDELDMSQPESISKFFQEKVFDVIINCAAYTAVDKAESEPELADQINHQAVKKLAQIAKVQDIILFHISTDYVFNGQNHKPYIETDPVAPINVYGLTKLKGEQAMQVVNPQGIIIRTSWVYSEFGNNFVKTMLALGEERDNLNVIFDQVGSPTYAGDLANAILKIIRHPCFQMQSKSSDIYHFSNEGVVSWYDFSKAIFEIDQKDCHVKPIETQCYPTPAKRPYYGLLNKAKIKQTFDIDIPYWKDSLRYCLRKLEK